MAVASKRAEGEGGAAGGTSTYPTWQGRSPVNFHLGIQPFFGFTAHIPIQCAGEASTLTETSSESCTRESASAKAAPDTAQQKPKAAATQRDGGGGERVEIGKNATGTFSLYKHHKRSGRIRRPVAVRVSRSATEAMARRILLLRRTRRMLLNHKRDEKFLRYDFAAKEQSSAAPLDIPHPATTPRYELLKEGKDDTQPFFVHQMMGRTDTTQPDSSGEKKEDTGASSAVEKDKVPTCKPAPSWQSKEKSNVKQRKLVHPASTAALRKILQSAPTRTTWSSGLEESISSIPALPVTPLLVSGMQATSSMATMVTMATAAAAAAHVGHPQAVPHAFVPVQVQGSQGTVQRHLFRVAPTIAIPSHPDHMHLQPRPVAMAGIAPFIQPYPMARFMIPPPVANQPVAGVAKTRPALSRAEWMRDKLLPPSPPAPEMEGMLQSREPVSSSQPVMYQPASAPATQPQSTMRPSTAAASRQQARQPHSAVAYAGQQGSVPTLNDQVRKEAPVSAATITTDPQLELPPLMSPAQARTFSPELRITSVELRECAARSAEAASGEDRTQRFSSAQSSARDSSPPSLRRHSIPSSANSHALGSPPISGSSQDEAPRSRAGGGGKEMHSRSRHRQQGNISDYLPEEGESLKAFRKRNSHLLQQLGWHAMQILLRKAREEKLAERQDDFLADSEPPPLIPKAATAPAARSSH